MSEQETLPAALPKLWAKSEPPEPLWCHSLDVAAVAFELIPYFGPVEGLSREWAAALAGLHDLGKADPLFQLKAPELAAVLPPELFDSVSAIGIRFRHEFRSADLVKAELQERWCRTGEPSGGRQSYIDIAARALLAHHGRFTLERAAAPDERDYPVRAARWRGLRQALYDVVITACRPDNPPPSGPVHADVSGVQLLGLTIVADWIASNRAIYRPPASEPIDPQRYLAAARTAAREAIQRIRLPLERPTPGPAPSWEDCWTGAYVPRGIQSVVVALAAGGIEPGLVIIEAATGEGKTEAAIHLAESWIARLGLAGMYVALPTQATSNSMHARMREYLSRRRPDAEALLVHGMAWLVDEVGVLPPPAQVDIGGEGAAEARREAELWLRNSRRALLAPFAVGTVDQVLLAALGVRFGVLRLFGLSNKVLIVDEVHACDTYMQTRLERALAWCRALRVPVILLSATLSGEQRLRLVHAYLGPKDATRRSEEAARRREDATLRNERRYPLVTAVGGASGTVTCHTTPIMATARRAVPQVALVRLPGLLADAAGRAALAERVLASVAQGGCAAVVVNTVGMAQEVYRAIRARADAELFTILFHARFPAWRRGELEDEVRVRFGKVPPTDRPRPARAVVVATQVVEQSLDLDFDVMFTELAPGDLILQRAGRLWRHERKLRPLPQAVLHVLTPPVGSYRFGASEYVYPRLYLLRTLGALATREWLTLPEDFRGLVEAIYDHSRAPCDGIPQTELDQAAEHEGEAAARDERDARVHLIGLPDPLAFRYPQQQLEVGEAEEGEYGDNLRALRAQTRKDDGVLRAAFAVTREEDRSLLTVGTLDRVPRHQLRRLMRTRVSVPAWWIARTTENESVTWTNGVPVLDLIEERAAGAVGYDEALGLVWRKGPEVEE